MSYCYKFEQQGGTLSTVDVSRILRTARPFFGLAWALRLRLTPCG